MYAIAISSAFFVFSGTVSTQDINRQININSNLWPLIMVGSMPMASTAQPEKGMFGISQCIGCVIIQLGKIVHIVYMYWYSAVCQDIILSTKNITLSCGLFELSLGIPCLHESWKLFFTSAF